MSASEKLKALEKHMRRHKTEMLYPESARLRNALPQIVALVEAAEAVSMIERTGVLPDFASLASALAALDEALT